MKKEIEKLVNELERVDRSLEDSNIKKYLKIANLVKQIEAICKEEKITTRSVLQNCRVIDSKLQRAKRIAKTIEWMNSNQISVDGLGVGHYEDIFRLRNKMKENEFEPTQIKAKVMEYVKRAENEKQNLIRKEFLPSREKTSKEVAFTEFIEFCKAQIGLREKSPVISRTADFRKIAYIIHTATRQYAKELELLVKSISVNVRNYYD